MNRSREETESFSDGSGIVRVGAWLKDAREERGIALDEVARVTRIGKNYLEAIEEGALGKLPNQAYTRGFIRLYAAHLGLSPEETLAMMDAGPAGHAEAFPGLTSGAQLLRSPPAYRRALKVIVALTLALAAGYFILKPVGKSSAPLQDSRVEQVPAVQTQKPMIPQQGQNTPHATEPAESPLSPPKPNGNQGIVLRLKAVSNGKLHITIDGSVSQEYDLVAGDLVEWKAKNEFMLDLDNAASVEGELDGVKLKPFGEQGRAAQLVLNADGIHK